MKIVNVDNIASVLNCSIPVGMGTSAICFLRSDGNIVKLYLNTYLKRQMFRYFDMEKQLKLLNKISNDTFIGPQEILVKNDEVIGYIYPYVKGKRIDRLSNKLTKEDILCSYQKLFDDTKRLEEYKIRLNDLHERNILFDNMYHVIDLDKCTINDNAHRFNMGDIIDLLVRSIFNTGAIYSIVFEESDLEELYREVRYNRNEDFNILIERIFDGCQNKGEVRKRRRYSVNEIDISYHRHF